MPKQEEHERVENLVESKHGQPTTAHNLEDAANADNEIEGYAAINVTDMKSEIANKAAELAQKRPPNDPAGRNDWFSADENVRRRHRDDDTGDDAVPDSGHTDKKA